MHIAKNTIYQIFARLISSASGFLVTIFIARYFGVSSYGDYAKVVGFVGLFYLLVDFGFNAIFLQKEDNHLRFRELFYSRLSLAFLLFLLVNIVVFFLPFDSLLKTGFSPLVKLGIRIFSFSFFAESILYSSLAVFQRKLSYESQLIATSIGSFLTVILVGLVSLMHVSLLFIFISFLIGGITESSVALLLTKEKLLPIILEKTFIKNLIKDTLPVVIMLVFNLVYFRIDVFLLAILKSSADVGVYDLSYRFFDFLIAIPLFLSNSFYPTLLQDEKNKQIVLAKVTKYLYLFLTIGIFISIVSWFFAPLIGIISKGFIPSIASFRILLFSLPIFFGTSILQWILLAKRKQKLLAYFYTFVAMLNILLNILFIPQYSYLGSGVITGVCETIIFLLLLIGVIYYGHKKHN